MPGAPLRLGPFIGGLNTSSDPTAIADAELAECINFELDIDGSLISRPPFVELNGHASWTSRIVMIGTGIFSDTAYLFGSNNNGVFYFLDGTWNLITSTFRATKAVQYDNKMWFVPSHLHTGLGGNWEPVGGFTVVAAIPVGWSAVIHKERLYIAPGFHATTNGSRLKFSDPAVFTTWPASNFIDIRPGDGSNLVDLTVYQDNLLLFKEDSSHVLAYDTRPADATLREISVTIGVTQQNCMVNYENQIYIYHRGWIYEVINYDFHRLNTKVPFLLDETTPSPFSDDKVFLSLLGDRLVIGYFNKTYVYGLRTRTWTEWLAKAPELHYFGPLIQLPATEFEFVDTSYFAGSRLQDQLEVVRINDGRSVAVKETLLDAETLVNDTFTRTVAAGSWGTSDSGHAWTTEDSNGANQDDFSVNGTKGLMSVDSRNISRLAFTVVTPQNLDITMTVSVDVVATGDWLSSFIFARLQDLSNFYLLHVEFKNTGNVGLSTSKKKAGATTTLGAIEIGPYLAGQEWKARLQIQDLHVRAKLWKAVDPEPVNWTLEALDSDGITSPGQIKIASLVNVANTNTLPVIFRYDNITITDLNLTTRTITCRAKTKNFDMAISHQFKRLWWWGADVTTNNDIIGRASPVVLSFNVTWQDLINTAWQNLNTWAQPLTETSDVVTVQSTGTGTARRFAKFLRSLRFRQINFEVELTTEGSTVDGPARLFTVTVITESKQVVPKGVN